MEETIERIVGFFRHAAQGLEERKQILYLLGPGRRRQVVAGRASQVADGGQSDLCAEGRRRTQSGVREPARSVRSGDAGTDDRGEIRHSAPSSDRADDALVLQAARGLRRRYLAVPRRQDPAVAAAADRRSPRPSPATRTTRTSPRWSARSTSASWRRSRRTIPTPTATPAASTAPTRAFLNSSRCSRRRSRCCIRC